MDQRKTVSKVRKNSEGDITEVMLNDGSVFSIEQAIALAKNNQLEGVNVGEARNGREFLRSNPDGDKTNNLDQLETF